MFLCVDMLFSFLYCFMVSLHKFRRTYSIMLMWIYFHHSTIIFLFYFDRNINYCRKKLYCVSVVLNIFVGAEHRLVKFYFCVVLKLMTFIEGTGVCWQLYDNGCIFLFHYHNFAEHLWQVYAKPEFRDTDWKPLNKVGWFNEMFFG